MATGDYFRIEEKITILKRCVKAIRLENTYIIITTDTDKEIFIQFKEHAESLKAFSEAQRQLA